MTSPCQFHNTRCLTNESNSTRKGLFSFLHHSYFAPNRRGRTFGIYRSCLATLTIWRRPAFETEGEHHGVRRRVAGAGGVVEAHRGGVGAVGEDPGFGAAEGAGLLEDAAEQARRQAATAVGDRDGDLVDPQLGRGFVGMDVADGGDEADHHAFIDGDNKMVARVGEELGGAGGVDRVVKHAGRDMLENGVVTGGEEFDFDWHRSPVTIRQASRGSSSPATPAHVNISDSQMSHFYHNIAKTSANRVTLWDIVGHAGCR